MATTIQIQKNTREKLKRLGHKGESYDNIIERLMSYFEELNVEKLRHHGSRRLRRPQAS